MRTEWTGWRAAPFQHAEPGGALTAAAGRRPGGRGAWALSAALAASGAVLFVAFVRSLLPLYPSFQLPGLLFVVAFAVAEITVLNAPLRMRIVPVSFGDIPLVVGLFLVAPAELVAAQLAGTALVLVFVRRRSLQELAFGLARMGFATSLAILVFRTALAVVPADLPTWIAAYPASLAVALVGTLAGAAWVAAAQGERRRGVLRAGLVVGVVTAVLDTSLALVLVVDLRTEASQLLLLVAPVVLAILGYHAIVSLRQRQARLEFLYDSTKVLQRAILDAGTLTRFLALTRGMFQAEVAEILLGDGEDDEPPIRSALGPGDAVDRTVPAEPRIARERMSLVSGEPGGLLVQRSARGPATPRSFAEEGFRDAVVVPVVVDGARVGTLLVANRPRECRTFDREDLRLLETLGTHLGVALQNSRLVDRLAESLADVSQLAAIVESSNDAILAVNPGGNISSWNRAATALFGYSAAEVIGRPARVLVPAELQAELASDFAGVSAGSVRRGITEIVCRDGARLPVSARVSPIIDRSGAVIGISAILRDETERRKAEAALNESAERFRSVFQGSPIGIGLLDTELRWTRVNETLCRMLEFDNDELVGRPCDELIHPDDVAGARELDRDLIASQNTGISTERRYVTASGRTIWARITARPLPDAGTRPPLALCMIEDVTATRLAAQRARDTEARLHRAIAAFTTVREPAGVLRAALEAARDLLDAEFAAVGVLSEDGSRFDEMHADGIDAATAARIGQPPTGRGVLGLADGATGAVRLADARTHPAAVGFPPGHPSIVSLLAVPIVMEGRMLARLWVGNKRESAEFSADDEVVATALAAQVAVVLANARIDARSQELLQELDAANAELKRANEAKSAFLASMSHELRTPLLAILVAAELVSDPLFGSLTDERIRELAGTIHGSGRHLLQLVDDLMDLSRIEASRLELRRLDLPVSRLLAEVLQEMTPLAGEKGLSLQAPPGPGPLIFADPLRVRQILVNLLSNAIKFSRPGGDIRVDVSATRTSVRITVNDTGVGIAAEDLERAFAPFEQVSGSPTPGAGLGLAISRRLAELHGGRLEAASTPEQGSSFSVTLPRGRPAGQPSTLTEPPVLSDSMAAWRPTSILRG